MENRVAEQIRFYRKQKGLTQEQMAEAMGGIRCGGEQMGAGNV